MKYITRAKVLDEDEPLTLVHRRVRLELEERHPRSEVTVAGQEVPNMWANHIGLHVQGTAHIWTVYPLDKVLWLEEYRD